MIRNPVNGPSAPRIFFRDSPLTFVTGSITCASSPVVKEAVRRHAGPSGEDGARERLCRPFPGGFRHQPAGTMTGTRGASL
jgi:hypothetical protein